MTKDELILDIVEKTYDKLEKLDGSVQEMKIEQARQNGIVEEHARRSTASEARLEFVEQHVLKVDATMKVLKNIGKISLGVVTIVGFFIKILPYFLAH